MIYIYIYIYKRSGWFSNLHTICEASISIFWKQQLKPLVYIIQSIKQTGNCRCFWKETTLIVIISWQIKSGTVSQITKGYPCPAQIIISLQWWRILLLCKVFSVSDPFLRWSCTYKIYGQIDGWIDWFLYTPDKLCLPGITKHSLVFN